MNKNINRLFITRKILSVLLCAILILSYCITAFADEEVLSADANETDLVLLSASDEYVLIYDSEDFLAIKDNPAGSYKLARDINMAGVEYEPFEFNGVLDGNGFAILNLNITSYSEDTRKVYDGNMKEYDTHFAGLFSIIDGANINNLLLLGETINVASDSEPLFAGGIAGYSNNSIIAYCSVVDAKFNVTSSAKCHGVGGIAGYGMGNICDCKFSGELVSVDTDKTFRDEEFLGGAYAAGCINLDEVDVNLQGYISDHGYVHSGGLVGMYIHYIKTSEMDGYDYHILNNTVSGSIHFFEDNTNRRAYCKAYVGEMMTWALEMSGNTSDFVRDEIFEYDTDLYPHTCEKATYTVNTIPSTYDVIGYSEYTCSECGYSYNADFTPRLVLIETVEASADTIELEKGKETFINFAVYPEDAYTGSIVFKSLDDSIVSIETMGMNDSLYQVKIKGNTAGSTDIVMFTGGDSAAHTTVVVKNVFNIKIAAIALIVMILGVFAFIKLAKKLGVTLGGMSGNNKKNEK